jgi:hypothetical protein
MNKDSAGAAEHLTARIIDFSNSRLMDSSLQDLRETVPLNPSAKLSTPHSGNSDHFPAFSFRRVRI